MSYGVSNETPWNFDAYDTKNATILPKISISLDPPTLKKSSHQEIIKLSSTKCLWITLSSYLAQTVQNLCSREGGRFVAQFRN